MYFVQKYIYTYFGLQEVQVGPGRQASPDHQHPHRDLGVLYIVSPALQGPLWDLENHWDPAGLSHKSHNSGLYNLAGETVSNKSKRNQKPYSYFILCE